MTALAIARSSLTRLLHDRTALLFIVVLPLVIIVIVGATVRGFSTWRVGVLDLGAGSAGRTIVSGLDHAGNLAVTRFTSEHTMVTAIARGELSAGAILPRGMTQEEEAGHPVTVALLVEHANTSSLAAGAAITSVVRAEGARVQAAQFATLHAGGTYEENLARAASVEAGLPRVTLQTVQAQTSSSTLPEGFSYSAPTEMVLFVFLSAVAAGAAIVETRRLGMYERMSAAPVRANSIVVGEALNYLTIAVAQSLLIVLVGALAFGVSWGDPLAAGTLLLVWSVVGASAGMLAGTVFRTPEQASAIAPVTGIVLGMLGGCMWPLSIVTPLMRGLGHVTPQAWAVDAWTDLLSHSGTVATILPELGILAAFAAAFLTLATVRLRRLVA